MNSIIVSVSEFREKLSDYLELIKNGEKKVIIKDKKKDRILAEVSNPKEKEDDRSEYINFVKRLGGKLLTEEDVADMRQFRNSFDKHFEDAWKK